MTQLDPVRRMLAAAWDAGYEAGVDDEAWVESGMLRGGATNPWADAKENDQ